MSSFYRRLPALIAIRFMPNSLQVKVLNWRAKKIPEANKIIDNNHLIQYSNSLQSVKYWHGTGRYKYNSSGEIEDILAGILRCGIKTYPDSYLTILSDDLQMDSISLVEKRNVARCYADIHFSRKDTCYRAGSPSFWLSQHYAEMYLNIYTKYAFKAFFRLPKWRRGVKLHTNESWSGKVNKRARNTWQSFDLGTDIAGNFPILIGVSHINRKADIPRVFAKTEIRSLDNIQISDIKHLEVPESKISYIKEKLNQAGVHHINVFDIEIGEYLLYHSVNTT